ncbi:serine hydrolase domain-containing protein [Chungangia koreensis]|uniref:Serine hydrolase domain-containing protein n=1 Tax=Chungangia koreensis TaxID=752657 RepID=A0ABV8X0Y3_9LACT
MDSVYVKERMDHHHVKGLSIAFVKNGEISETLCLGVRDKDNEQKIDTDTLFHACSMSKFVTAMAVLKLVEKGLLEIDGDVNKMLSTWRIPDHAFTKNVTIRHLLSHQSGIVDAEGSFYEFNEQDGIPSMVDLLEGRTPYHREPVKVSVEPGSEFHYSDAGFCILQQVIEDVTGKEFSVVLSELIFEPLQMNNSTVNFEPTGKFASGHNKLGEVVKGKYPIYPYPAAAGLWSTPSEVAALVLELTLSIKGQSKIDLSAHLAREMVSPQGGMNWSGLGVFLDETEHGMEFSSLGWGVGFQSMMAAHPDIASGVVVMTNADLGVHQLDGIIGEVYRNYLSGIEENGSSC